MGFEYYLNERSKFTESQSSQPWFSRLYWYLWYSLVFITTQRWYIAAPYIRSHLDSIESPNRCQEYGDIGWYRIVGMDRFFVGRGNKILPSLEGTLSEGICLNNSSSLFILTINLYERHLRRLSYAIIYWPRQTQTTFFVASSNYVTITLMFNRFRAERVELWVARWVSTWCATCDSWLSFIFHSKVGLRAGPSVDLSQPSLLPRSTVMQYRLTDTGAVFFERGTGGGVLWLNRLF